MGRTTSGVIDTVNDLKERGVAVVSLNEDIRADTAANKLMFIIFAALAEMERNLIAERTQAGVDAKRKRGGAHGRPHLIADFPKRVQTVRDFLEEHGDEAFGDLTDKQKLEMLNKADRKAPKIESEKTIARWRRDGFKGI